MKFSDIKSLGACLLAAVALLGGAGQAAAATYYVNNASGSASDSNAGTAALPWKTIQKASTTMVAGDTALVSAGTYNESVTSSRSGTAGNQITFRATGTVVMKGFTLNHNYLTVDGFLITAVSQSMSVSINGTYCQLLNMTIHDSGINTSTEINLGASSANCLVQSNLLYSSIAYGNDHPVITIRGSNNVANGNEIGPFVDADGFRPFGVGNVMRNNYLHDLRLSSGSIAHMDVFQTFGDSGDSAYNIVFENNLIMNTDSQLFMTSVDGQNIHDFDVRNNIYVSTLLQGNIGMPNFRFYNNLCYNVDPANGTCLILYNQPWGVANNTKIKNNIFIAPGGLGYSAGYAYVYANSNQNWFPTPAADGLSGVETDYNYVTGDPTKGYPAMANFSEVHGINGGDPKFVNLAAWDFHLQAGSPAIDRGVTLTNFNYDKDGVARPQGAGWDIGPYEFGAPNPNPPVASAVQATALSSSSAQVTWITDQPATSLVQYGLTTGYGSSTNNGALVTNHSVTLTALAASATYHYRVQSANGAGLTNSFSTDQTFATPAVDNIPPTVFLTAPSPGAVISGPVTLTATAADNVGVAGVQFLIDGQPVGAEVTVAPYAYSWSPFSVTNGTHTVQARARDGSGNTALSLPLISIQVQNAVTSGLVGYWPFDEGAGTSAADFSGQSGSVTLNGVGWRTGAVGSSALSFSGGSSSASAPDGAALRASGDLTLSLWINHTALPASGSWMYYVDKGAYNSENYGFGAYTDAGGTRLFFEFYDSTGAYSYFTQATGATLSAGVWTQVAVAFDHTQGQVLFYINGQQVKSTATAQSLKATTDPLVLGQQNITGYEFRLNGGLDDLRIYSRAITPVEVQALTALGLPSPPTGLRVVSPGP